MTMQEAIDKREELLVEERKVNHAIKVFNSDTMPECAMAGVKMAIGQCNRRLREITDEIRELADNIGEEAEENQRVKPFVMYGENDAVKPAANDTKSTGDEDIDFLVNLFRKAKVTVSEQKNGDQFITILKALFDED